ncbi:hypothetical protein [Vibrio sp. T20]|uniref:hypothetical protein n=1 Tax=Vibrio sp. T20 TaxID=2588450 RepID=UPI0039657C21
MQYLSKIGIALETIFKVPTDDNLRIIPDNLKEIISGLEGTMLVYAQPVVLIPVLSTNFMNWLMLSRTMATRGFT